MLGDFRCIEGSVRLVEQAHAGKDGDDQVVMREINIDRSVQWEGLRG